MQKMLKCKSGQTIPFDYCISCTAVHGQSWLGQSGLEVDPQGFVCVEDTLQSLHDEKVFAAGDCATLIHNPCPKAGVFAVRQGMILEQNLRRHLLGLPLVPYVPQKEFLGLIGTGDGDCIASRGKMALQGKWLWELKTKIDLGWMRGYTKDIPTSADKKIV